MQTEHRYLQKVMVWQRNYPGIALASASLDISRKIVSDGDFKLISSAIIFGIPTWK